MVPSSTPWLGRLFASFPMEGMCPGRGGSCSWYYFSSVTWLRGLSCEALTTTQCPRKIWAPKSSIPSPIEQSCLLESLYSSLGVSSRLSTRIQLPGPAFLLSLSFFQGDSGGPLICDGVLQGTTLNDPEPCCTLAFPGIYTKDAHLLNKRYYDKKMPKYHIVPCFFFNPP